MSLDEILWVVNWGITRIILQLKSKKEIFGDQLYFLYCSGKSFNTSIGAPANIFHTICVSFSKILMLFETSLIDHHLLIIKQIIRLPSEKNRKTS